MKNKNTNKFLGFWGLEQRKRVRRFEMKMFFGALLALLLFGWVFLRAVNVEPIVTPNVLVVTPEVSEAVESEVKEIEIPTPIGPVALTSVEFTGASLVEVTAYSELDSCHYEGCPMANGIRAQVGYIACPRHIPLGTKVEIETLGEFECGDRTAKYLDGRYDVFMGWGEESYQKAIEFGVKKLRVVVL
jgi:3D (Asp-Asp-Asp) domain-containing protein